jgi:hypothetical protein
MAVMVVLPEATFAGSAFSGSSMKEIISGFFTIPLVKGLIMSGTIGGGLFLVLSGFGIIGGDKPDPKKIILGGILTGIGLSYPSLTKKLASQFN